VLQGYVTPTTHVYNKFGLLEIVIIVLLTFAACCQHWTD